MKSSILVLTLGSLLVAACLGRQDSTGQKREITVPGKEALALRVAMSWFDRHTHGTVQQRDLSHYTFTIRSNDTYYFVVFDQGVGPNDNFRRIDWISPEGFNETVVIDRKTLRYVRTEVVA